MDSISLPDFVQFLTIKKGLRSGSVKICRTRFEIVRKWLCNNHLALNKQSIELFLYTLKQKDLKNNSINAYIFFIRYFQAYCSDRELPFDFLAGITSLPKNRTFIEPLSDDEVHRLYSTSLNYGTFRGRDSQPLDFIHRTMIKFIAMTGCRFEEAQLLQIEHLDLVYHFASFIKTKNGDIRRIPLINKSLVDDLTQLTKKRKKNDYVFTNLMGKKIHHSDFTIWVKKYKEAAGITKVVTPHKLRHSFASSLSDQNTPIEEISKLLGHRDIQTTYDTYIHIGDKRLERAISRHPLVGKGIPRMEKLKIVEETIETFNLDKEDILGLIALLEAKTKIVS